MDNMYTIGIVLTIVGVVGIIGTLIWIFVDNHKKNKQRQSTINSIRNQQYEPHFQYSRVKNYRAANSRPYVSPNQEFDLTEGLSNNYPNQHINKTQYTNQNSEQDFNRQLNPNIYQDLQTENLMTDSLFNSDVNTESLVYTDGTSESLVDDGENYTETIQDDIKDYETSDVCPNCKTPLKQGAKFCSHCGTRLV